jgi:hypothetical protein
VGLLRGFSRTAADQQTNRPGTYISQECKKYASGAALLGFVPDHQDRHLSEVADAIGGGAFQDVGEEPVAVRRHGDEIDMLLLGDP